MSQPPARTLREVFALYQEQGAQPYGEAVSQLEHGLQCAALAEQAKAADSLVAAALLHDIGHFILGGAPETLAAEHAHETTGAEYLNQLFGPEVTAPIALHVMAKRYLSARDKVYQAQLSPASQRSLQHQGGPLNAKQCEQFEQQRFYRDALRLRAWDDAGKIEQTSLRCLDDYQPLLSRLLSHSQQGSMRV